IFKSDAEKQAVAEFVDKVVGALAGAEEVAAGAKRLSADGVKSYFFDKHTGQKIVVDWRDARPGDKQYHWEQRGVPLRIEVGPRDVAAGVMVLKRRLDRAKENLPLKDLSPTWLRGRIDQIHTAMFEK